MKEHHGPSERHHRLRRTWPITWSDAGLLFAFYIAMAAVWSGIGQVIKHVADGRSLGKWDQDIEVWLVQHQTPTRNAWSLVGSMLSETAIKVAITVTVCLVLLRVLHRWYESLVIAVSLIIEAMIFLTVTRIVGRPRPDVPKLDGSPVSSSFPSGHTAAAMCYIAIAVVVFWHTRRTWIRVIAVVVSAFVPVAVGFARLYRGMHHLTDVVAGALIGGMSVVFCTWVLQRAEARRLAAQHDASEATVTPAQIPMTPVGAA